MLQSSGPISLLDLKNEFGGTDPVSLGDYYRGSALNTSPSTNVPTSGAISIGMFYGLSAVNDFVFNQTIQSDTNKYNLYAELINAGWNGTNLVNATITINSGIVVYSDTTASPAFDIPNTIPDGSIININNYGYIVGMGGAGGSNSNTATAGGPALQTSKPITITNSGTIGGGGGGGSAYTSLGSYGGGGGRTGRTNSDGGVGTKGTGSSGTFNYAGIGSGSAGSGGNWGNPGNSGNVTSSPGAGGAAVVGNSNITWLSIGTRMGALT